MGHGAGTVAACTISIAPSSTLVGGWEYAGACGNGDRRKTHFELGASEGREKKKEGRSTEALTLGAKGLNPPVPLMLLCLVAAVMVVVAVVHVCLCRVGWEMCET